MDSGRAAPAADDAAETQESLLDMRQFMDMTLNDFNLSMMPSTTYSATSSTTTITSSSAEAAAAAAPTRASSRAAIVEAPRDDVDDWQEQDNCAICLDRDDAAAAEWKETPCGHRFHGGCLDKWLEAAYATCPMCRRHVTPPPIADEDDDDDSESDDDDDDDDPVLLFSPRGHLRRRLPEDDDDPRREHARRRFA